MEKPITYVGLMCTKRRSRWRCRREVDAVPKRQNDAGPAFPALVRDRGRNDEVSDGEREWTAVDPSMDLEPVRDDVD